MLSQSKGTQTVAYTYDFDGNQLTVTTVPYVNGVPQTAQVTTCTYDKFNQLTLTVTPDGTNVTNTYNGEGLRVVKQVDSQISKYVCVGDKVILELDGSGNQTARNIQGTNLIARSVDGTTLYYMYNGHADVTALLDSTETIQGTYYYDAFGNIKESTGNVNNPFTYAGYQYDKENGLYYLNSRMYDPVTARFLQEDTYGGDPIDPLSLNRYTYTLNNPLRYYDRTGHMPDRYDGSDYDGSYGYDYSYDYSDDYSSDCGANQTQEYNFEPEPTYTETTSLHTNDNYNNYQATTPSNNAIADYRTIDNSPTQETKSTSEINSPSSSERTTNTSGDCGSGNHNRERDNYTTPSQPQPNTGRDFLTGVLEATDNNMSFGGAQQASNALIGERQEPNSTAYHVGKLVGDTCSLIAGTGVAVTGFGGEVVGFGLDGTGVLAPAGIAVNVASAGAVVYGGTVINRSSSNLGQDAKDMFMEARSGGNGSGSNAITSKNINDLPENVQNSYNQYDESGWKGNVSGQSAGTKAGGSYRNSKGDLPTTDAAGNPIKYSEFDVNNKLPNSNRDTERFVFGSDGSIHYTDSHYGDIGSPTGLPSFVKLK